MALCCVDNAKSKGDFRDKYYELGRKSKAEGGTGRWATTIANETGVGAATIVAGADGTGKPVYERKNYRDGDGSNARNLSTAQKSKL